MLARCVVDRGADLESIDALHSNSLPHDLLSYHMLLAHELVLFFFFGLEEGPPVDLVLNVTLVEEANRQADYHRVQAQELLERNHCFTALHEVHKWSSSGFAAFFECLRLLRRQFG